MALHLITGYDCNNNHNLEWYYLNWPIKATGRDNQTILASQKLNDQEWIKAGNQYTTISLPVALEILSYIK